jgi:hypothetical protein
LQLEATIAERTEYAYIHTYMRGYIHTYIDAHIDASCQDMRNLTSGAESKTVYTYIHAYTHTHTHTRPGYTRLHLGSYDR